MSSLVLFHRNVVEYFDSLIPKVKGRHEIGGIFIGSIRGEHIEIVTYTTPGQKDRSSMYKFVRQDTSHNKFAHVQWLKFKRKRTYLGEWHSHPSGDPNPSVVDFKTWIDVANQQKRNTVFVIISPTGWSPYLAIPNNFSTPVFKLALHEEGEVGSTYVRLLSEK